MSIAKGAILYVLILSSACSHAPQGARPDAWAAEVEVTGLNNIYMVSPDLYRSEQPDGDAFVQLDGLGIKSVLNLRNSQTDLDETESTDLDLYLIKMSVGNVSEEELFEALQVIRDAESPVLVHCWHGSDRAGAVVAAYRIVFQDWSKEDAIDEFKNGGYGYHKFFYPNLVDVLERLDVARLKSELDL